MIIKFGKYKGQDLMVIPIDYLRWLEEHLDNTNKDLVEEIRWELKRRVNPSLGRVIKKAEN